MKIKNFKLTQIGGSKYIIVPNEYVEVFKLDENIYDFYVEDGGNKLIYKKRRQTKDGDTKKKNKK